jgi:hypothetical protein
MVINKKTKSGPHASESPDWDLAPDWATYVVHDLFTGQWIWLEKHPHNWRDGKKAMVNVWERLRRNGEA